MVRARGIAGDAGLLTAFDALRGEVLAAPREATQLCIDVATMRRKMRTELDRSDAAWFDLKQGEGGLVDLEFLLQCLVLRDAHACPRLLEARGTPALLEIVREVGSLGSGRVDALREAHALLLDKGLRCTLDRRPRGAPQDDATLASAREAVRSALGSIGLV